MMAKGTWPYGVEGCLYRASVSPNPTWSTDRPSPWMARAARRCRGGRILFAFDTHEACLYFVESHSHQGAQTEADGAQTATALRRPEPGSRNVAEASLETLISRGQELAELSRQSDALARQSLLEPFLEMLPSDVTGSADEHLSAITPAARFLMALYDAGFGRLTDIARVQFAMVQKLRENASYRAAGSPELFRFKPSSLGSEPYGTLLAALRSQVRQDENEAALAHAIEPVLEEMAGQRDRQAMVAIIGRVPHGYLKAGLYDAMKYGRWKDVGPKSAAEHQAIGAGPA